MNASPAWLETMARGAAERDQRRERPQDEWGRPRLSRRRVMGTAASTVIAASALRFVSPAYGQTPGCVSPCLKAAAASAALGIKRNFNQLEKRMVGWQNQLDDLKLAKRKAKTARAKAKIQRQIDANIQNQLRDLDIFRDYQEDTYQEMLEKQDKCKSGPECGDPVKYPGGNAPPPPPPGGVQCGDPAAACGDLCCASLSRCCSACKTCCVDGVSCSDCCPA